VNSTWTARRVALVAADAIPVNDDALGRTRTHDRPLARSTVARSAESGRDTSPVQAARRTGDYHFYRPTTSRSKTDVKITTVGPELDPTTPVNDQG
jgi:hypothetical protein